MSAQQKIKFRDEAIAARQTESLGSIIFIRPISFTFMAVFAGIVVTFFLLLLIFGSYTQKNTVDGELVPNSGIVKVNSVQKGVIVNTNVTEGQVVKRGDILFVIKDSTYESSSQDVSGIIASEINKNIDNIHKDTSNNESNQKYFSKAFEDKIRSIDEEYKKLLEQIVIQDERVSLAKNFTEKYRKFRASGLITEEQLLQKEIDYINQKEELNILSQKKISLLRQQSDVKNTAKENQFNNLGSASKLDRELAENRQKLIEITSKNTFTMVAPINGSVSAIVVADGQSIESGQVLASIVPEDYYLHARLLVPSKAIGFVREKLDVSIRYQAYPYQRFGQQKGKVTSVSQLPIMLRDTKFNYSGKNLAAANEEPMFIVDVALDDQALLFRRDRYPLKAGMMLEADLKYSKTPLYMWIFEPLISLSKM